ncbi:transporter [Williamsia sp. CHRR-6]|uniref:PH-like domain-containing protein n=1 Tax=Williamsia sp. CHRR-6 TaxID=2835871 RepID=UPI0020246163|nr:transporter [Williamsia sp. CHRR-6]
MTGVVVVVVVLIAWGGIVALMVRGWRNRGQRQHDVIGVFPEVPADPGTLLLGPDTGLYVGSTIAPRWMDRVAVGDYGDRAKSRFSLYDTGVLIDRDGANPIWIPQESTIAIRTERGLAGKVMSADGLIVIRWRLPSGTEIDSGLRGDDKTRYPLWVSHDPRLDPTPDDTTAGGQSSSTANDSTDQAPSPRGGETSEDER